MRPIEALVEAEVTHPEVGGQVDDEPGRGLEYFGRHFRGFPMLKREEHDIAMPGGFPGPEPAEPRVGKAGECRVDVGDRPASLARPLR
jgi:hypothetical protein